MVVVLEAELLHAAGEAERTLAGRAAMAAASQRVGGYRPLARARSLLPFNGGDDPDAAGKDFSRYRLRLADFAHALFAVIVFAAVALLADGNTVACFYPGLMEQQKQLAIALPVVIGALASGFFVVFPSTRHGLGYPPMTPAATALLSQ